MQVARPTLGDRLELAVAVELVAKQVAKHDRARVQLRCDRVEPQLVDLEQPQLAGDRAVRARRREQRRRDPARHVRALGVVDERDARALEDARGHRRRRRLPVRRGDEGAALSQARSERADRVAVEADQHAPGSARCAVAAQPRERCDGARERELRRERERHQRASAASAGPAANAESGGS